MQLETEGNCSQNLQANDSITYAHNQDVTNANPAVIKDVLQQ
jgi:hypothetical protein